MALCNKACENGGNDEKNEKGNEENACVCSLFDLLFNRRDIHWFGFR